MSGRQDEARLALEKAREALRNNDRGEARRWAERAASLSPKLEDPWLILAAVASPSTSLEYVRKALKVNPNSARARRTMEWAMQRLREPETPLAETRKNPAIRPDGAGSASAPATAASAPRAKRPNRTAIAAFTLLALGCVVCAAAGVSAMASPVVASIIPRPALASQPTLAPAWAEAEIPKPTYTPESPLAEVLAQAATATAELVQTPAAEQPDLSTSVSTDLPTALSPELPTEQPTEMAAELPTATGEPESSVPTAESPWSGVFSMEVLPDTPTAEAPPYVPAATSVAGVPGDETSGGTHWIDVNLSQQMVYAYEGDALVNSFLVSTGTWMTPTVTGKYHIYVKLRYTDMSGPDYYLPDVPYTMYFFKGYGLHGTYWHHNFGTPMSHGCVNLSIPDAQWLYNFSSVGTLVNVHY